MKNSVEECTCCQGSGERECDWCHGTGTRCLYKLHHTARSSPRHTASLSSSTVTPYPSVCALAGIMTVGDSVYTATASKHCPVCKSKVSTARDTARKDAAKMQLRWHKQHSAKAIAQQSCVPAWSLLARSVGGVLCGEETAQHIELHLPYVPHCCCALYAGLRQVPVLQRDGVESQVARSDT